MSGGGGGGSDDVELTALNEAFESGDFATYPPTLRTQQN